MNDNRKSITHDAFTQLAKLVEVFFINHVNYLDATEWKIPNDPENDLMAINSYWQDTILYIYKELHVAKLQDELRFFQTEFHAFFEHVIADNFGNDYRPHFNVGREISVNTFKLLADTEQAWHVEVEPFLRQKKRLYSLLHDFKEQIAEPQELIETSSLKSIIKKAPMTLQDCFNDKANWRKYIDALCNTQPPLLMPGYHFIGHKRPHVGVIGGWIALLKQNNVIANLPRPVLAKVLNENIKGLNMGADGSSIRLSQPTFEKKFKGQLNRLIQ